MTDVMAPLAVDEDLDLVVARFDEDEEKDGWGTGKADWEEGDEDEWEEDDDWDDEDDEDDEDWEEEDEEWSEDEDWEGDEI